MPAIVTRPGRLHQHRARKAMRPGIRATVGGMRWLFHVAERGQVAPMAGGQYAPASLAREGFVHGSYRDAVAESARLYFPVGAALALFAVDPRRLDVPVEVVATPRGPMPHVHGAIPADAMRELAWAELAAHDDQVRGTHIGFAAFPGMTLLDLVGPLDALSRIATMGFDPGTRCEVFALVEGEPAATVWSGCGLEVRAARTRPPLDDFDVLVVPGGHGTRALALDGGVAAYLASYPHNRLVASVCTGALLLGAAGRLGGRRATTHASALAELPRYGAAVVDARVVDDGQLVTAGGVTAGLDLGVHLVRRLAGEAVAAAIARQMALPGS